MPTETWNSDRRSSRAKRQLGASPRPRTAGSGSRPASSLQTAWRHEPSSAHELQRLRGVEAAGDARACGPHRQSASAGLGPEAPAAASASPTGSIAGARSPRGNSRPTACITARAGVRGAKVNRIERLRARREAGERRAPRPQRRSGSASPSRRRGRSGRARDRACRRPGTRSAAAEIARQRARGPARSASARGRSRRPGAAPRRLHRERAGAAAGIEHAAAAKVGGQPGEQRGAHRVAAGAHGGADPADRCVRRQARPRLDRGAVEIGLELAARRSVGRGRGISRTPAGRRCRDPSSAPASSGSVPAHSASASRRYSSCTASTSGRGLHLEQRRLLQAAAPDHVEVREVREAS